MSNQNHQDEDNAEQPRTRPENALGASGALTIRRPRPGSVVIVAPAGTPVSIGGTVECMKVVLWPDIGE
jgi:hypothetical protein